MQFVFLGNKILSMLKPSTRHVSDESFISMSQCLIIHCIHIISNFEFKDMQRGKVFMTQIILPGMVVQLIHFVYQVTQNLAIEQHLVKVIFMAQNTRTIFLQVEQLMKMCHALCVGPPIPSHL